MKTIVQTTVCIVLAVLLSACSNDLAENKFSNYKAEFVFSPVTSVAPLHAALNGFGEFCTIWANANHFYFSSLTGSTKVNRDDLSAYRPYRCVGGFIVGRAGLPETGSTEYPYVCYDLTCPNCYKYDNISKALKIKEGGRAVCERCKRAYDLNNEGMIVEGEKGKKLIRYRMQYYSNTLSIHN